MNSRQAKWIVEVLCPFILREHGRGFGMSDWRMHSHAGDCISVDGINRKVPSCGTVACIGGSIELLKQVDELFTTSELAAVIGLSSCQANNLFYHWESEWPIEFSRRYEQSRTPLGKARVAVALLKLVAKTRGKCLDRRLT